MEQFTILDGEIWRDIKRAKGFQISNYGRLKSPKEHILTPIMRDGRLERIIRCDNTRYNISIAQEVWKAFYGETKNDRPKIYYKDKNPYNCRLDNLIISRGRPSERNIQIYTEQIYIAIKKVAYGLNPNCITCFDFDDFMQESALVCYKELFKYDESKCPSFVSWARKYIKFCFLEECKKAKTRRKILIYDERIKTEEKNSEWI